MLRIMYILYFIVVFNFIHAAILCAESNEGDNLELLIVSMADGFSDDYNRFMRSARIMKHKIHVLGRERDYIEPDEGVDWRLNILRQSLELYANRRKLVLLYTESRSTIIQSDKEEIIKKFKGTHCNVLMSATDIDINDGMNLTYPDTWSEKGLQYLSSRGFIGYAPDVYRMLTFSDEFTGNDQLYYTNILLKHANTFNMKLDRGAIVFQNLDATECEVDLRMYGQNIRAYNVHMKIVPAVISADLNMTNILHLNYLANYIPDRFSFQTGCKSCLENRINLDDIALDKRPTILIGIFILLPTPFIDMFLKQIANLDYPKNKIHIFIYNMEPTHNAIVDEWVKEIGDEYKSVENLKSRPKLLEHNARNKGIFRWRRLDTDYYFSVDSSVSLTNQNALRLLIEQNRPIIAPMVVYYGKYLSNFWGAMTPDGEYERSEDYMNIVDGNRVGVWNVPFISKVYLIKSSLRYKIGINPYSHTLLPDNADTDFCDHLRHEGVFMYVTNVANYGHLKSMKIVAPDKVHSDLYQLVENRLDWEEKYIHPEYEQYTEPEASTKQPCPDVYWVPVVSRAFAKHLIDECEHFGKWSDGGHKDKRIQGGYEAVPTIDIHMHQIGFEDHWLKMLADYFAPVVQKIFHYGSKSISLMNFVVKYTLDGQYLLRPHHDASTYTINLALNDHTKEYEGGGAHFLRYNCSVIYTQVGWALLHPGRLTHYHEGLRLRNGTRYIMVSFVDP